jgi:plasmid stabilization system protein ParE
MKNISKVVWSRKAKADLQGIITYLEENWTEREITNFFRKLDK